MSLVAVSAFCGVSYMILYSASLVLPCVLNYKNHSTLGYSTEFSLISIGGFFFLLLNQLTGFVNPFSEAGAISFWALSFAVIALLFASGQITQIMIYPSEPCRREVIGAVAFVFFGFCALWILEIQFNVPSSTIVGISLLGYMAWAKALSTLTKYLY